MSSIAVEFPYVHYEYVLLPLVNKEATLAYGRAEYSQVGNPNTPPPQFRPDDIASQPPPKSHKAS